MNISNVVRLVKKGDTQSFTELVLKFQNMSLGYAYSLTGDFRQAQDIVQESFLTAYSRIKSLENDELFSSWLRGIIYRKAHRHFRSHKPYVELSEQFEKGTNCLDENLQKSQERDILTSAIKKLPELERQVITMYYLEENSQKEVANFLGIPASTVNNKLFSARKILKGRMKKMASDTFKEQRLTEEFAKNIGSIVNIQGSVIDAKITGKENLEVMDVIGTQSGKKPKGYMYVAQRLKDGSVRCLGNADDILDKKYHLSFEGTNSIQDQIKQKTNDQMRSIVLPIVGKIDKRPEVLETGIKIIDFFTPLKKDGSFGIFGAQGVGRAVLAAELFDRRTDLLGNQSMFFYVDQWNLLGTQDLIETEKFFKEDIQDNLQIAWIVDNRGVNPFYAKDADFFDARVYCSPLLALEGVWPAIDPVYSKSEMLKENIVGENHHRTARDAIKILTKMRELTIDSKVYELLSLGARKEAYDQLEKSYQEKMLKFTPEQKLIVTRGRKLQLFFSQPFFVAEYLTGIQGEKVTLNDTINCVKKILNGELDNTEEEYFKFKGKI